MGAVVNTNAFFTEYTFDPQTIKVVHSRFHVIRPSDETSWAWIPYNELRSYEASEVAAGRPPIFVTATYQGKSRPVLGSWSLGLSGGVPTTAPSAWEYAVNVQDDRYIRFWINRYIREIQYANLPDAPNYWIGLDECAFIPALYGVLDDNNHFVSGVTWDPPFAQTQAAYLNSITYFFNRVKQLAPDLNLMPNSGGIVDWSQFSNVFGAAPGLMSEEINPSADAANPTSGGYTRQLQANIINAYSGMSAKGAVMILQSYFPQNNAVQSQASYAMYLLMKGPNTFYSPTIEGTNTALPSSNYSLWDALLGAPTGQVQSQGSGTLPASTGYALYSRQFQGGTVYLNWTGATQTVALKGTYYDVNGNQISKLVISDLTSAIALTSPNPTRPSRPRISPRYSIPADGSVSAQVTNANGDSNSIMYSASSSSSPAATAQALPANDQLTLTSNTQLSATAFSAAGLPSFPASASFTIQQTQPQIRIASSGDTGPAGIYYPVVALDSISGSPVSVHYYVASATAAAVYGVVTINPGEQYKYFPIAVSGSTLMSIWGATGATIAAPYTVNYMGQ